jgi:DNA polymerase-1
MSIGASWSDVPVSPEHARYLESQAAITPDVALTAGIRSASAVEDLPAWAQSWGEAALPALIFPWRSPSGEVVEQVRPDTPVRWGLDDHKYLWPKGGGAVLNVVRDGAASAAILIVEGTKQMHAAASWAPEGLGVYGIGGCRAWYTDGVPLHDLGVAEGKRVVIALDADVATNLDVYQAGSRLADAVRAEGALEVAFVRLPAAGTMGLDDVLARRPTDRRTSYLANLIDQAKPKPADRRPTAKRAKGGVSGANRAASAAIDPNRPFIEVDRDRLLVINEVTDTLVARWDGDRLFAHGGVISQRYEAAMEPLSKGSFLDLLQETAATGKKIDDEDGGEAAYVYGWPDGQTCDAVLSRSRRFSRLDRIARAPFVRPDGSICQVNGYDEDAATFVIMDERLSGIHVPDDPTADEVAQAVKYLSDEWLGGGTSSLFGDMASDADRANALALILTPFVRGLMDLVPLAVVDGKEAGVGKNLFVDVVSILATGTVVEPLGWSADDEENRKVITSAFRTSADVFAFDEAHHLHGVSLARALTSATWKDRQLGVSQMLGFPNRVTWVSMGNQVRVEGDITRRVYRVALRPEHPDPKNRPGSMFRHEDLREWTREHRGELLTAVLTMVRAWYAAGQPSAARRGFGSFERWEKVVGGILAHAGVTGFLDNLEEWRSETSFEARYWAAHVAWLRKTFGERTFTTAEARDAMAADMHSEPPPGLTDLAGDRRAYNRSLGAAYARVVDRWFGRLQFVKVGSAHGHVGAWMVVEQDEPMSPVAAVVPDSPHGSGGTGGTPTPYAYEPEKTHVGASPRDYAITDAHAFPRKSAAVSVPPSSPTPPESPANGGQPGEPAPLAEPDLSNPHGVTPSLFDVEPVTPEAEYTAVHLGEVVERGAVDLPSGVLSFDLETASSEELWSYGEGFVRIAGYQLGDRVRVTDRPGDVVGLLRSATKIIGHNIMSFDLVALMRYHGLALDEVFAMVDEGRVLDTMLAAVLLEPPPARTKIEQVMRDYSLDALGDKRVGVTKAGDLKALAKKFGGFDRIPVNDSEYVRYLVGDVDLSSRLAATLRTSAYVRREHKIAAIAAHMRMNGFRVDVAELGRRVAAGRERRRELTARLADRYGLPMTKADGKPAKSPHATKEGKAALDRAFADLGVALPRTKGGLPALGKDALTAVAEAWSEREDIRELVETVQSLNGVRTVYETVERALVGDRVHPEVSMFQASGRWSTTNPGLTVMGKRGGRYVEREVLLPDEGHVIISADLSQVDARAVAAWSQDPNYLDLFEPGRDSHTEIAQAVWGDPGRRDDAKILGHGWNYGMGLTKLAAKIGSEDVAREFDRSMKDRFPGLVTWKREVAEMADAGVTLDNGFGRKLRTSPGYGWTQGPALLGQSAARDIMMEGLLRLPREILPYLRAVVHDEIVLSIPADQADDIERAVLDALSFEWCPHEGGRPVRIEAGLGERRGRTWGHVYEKEPK